MISRRPYLSEDGLAVALRMELVMDKRRRFLADGVRWWRGFVTS